jgi:hypothetical protein
MRIPTRLALPALTLLIAASSASAAGVYDGQWSVQLVTHEGSCSASYNWSVDVTDNRIADPGMFVQTAGEIDPRGRVVLHITHGSDIVAASGKIEGATARGAWRSPTSRCAGAWTAQRS